MNRSVITAHVQHARELCAEYLFCIIRKDLLPSPFVWKVEVGHMQDECRRRRCEGRRYGGSRRGEMKLC